LRHLCGKVLPTKKKDSVTADSLGLLKMERYTKEQRVFIVEQYFKNNEGLAATVHNFRTKYGRNSDLTPLDFFLWGFLKSKVYANKPTTTHALKEEIERCINEIQPHLCKTVMENFDKRVRMCQQSRGGHLPDMLFHT